MYKIEPKLQINQYKVTMGTPALTMDLFFKTQNSRFCPLFNACHQVKLEKNLMSRFRRKIILGHKMHHLFHFRYNINLPLKSKKVTLNHLNCPLVQFQKILINRVREYFSCWVWVQKSSVYPINEITRICL